MRFDELIDRASTLLRGRRRMSARALQLQFDLDPATLEALCAELVTVLRVATERDGALEWCGESAAAAPHSESERRILSVMFCDLVGSTELASTLDPEDLHTVLRSYQSRAAEVVERFDGYIAQYLGDGVLVYFGWPVAHEDDAVRAVSAATQLVEGVSRLAADLVARGLPRIQVRISVHTGPTVVGEVGAGHRFESLALGETPNLGARLQGEARPGTVVISDETRRLVEGYFRLEDVGVREIRGIARPVHVFEVAGASGARGRIDAAGARGLTPLVNREPERELLKDAFAAVRSGKRTAVLLRGEAGIGKSRLQHYVKQSLVTGDRASFECHCSPMHANTALHPLAEALRLTWGLDASTDPLARIDAVLGQYEDLSVDESRALVASLVGLPIDAVRLGTVGEWTPQRRRQRTFELLVDLVRREAAQRPVLFIVEDLHWVDPSTLEFIGALFEGTEDSSVFMVMTARPEMAWPLEGRAGTRVVELARFGREHSVELVKSAAGSALLGPEATARLAERTDGIPFFLEELTRTVIESAAMQGADDATMSDRILSGTIPNSLYGCLMARLDREALVRSVAQVGAMLGPAFSRPLLGAVIDLDDEAIDDGLQRAIDAQILRRVGAGADAVYSFRHALFQDAARESILKRTRRQLHARVADTLVSRFAAEAAKEPETVAQHYTEAEEWPHAIEWWIKAGQGAIARFANAEAIAHLTRAVSIVERLTKSPGLEASELALRVLLAIPLTMTRGWAAPEVVAQYRRAEELCSRVGDTPQLFPTLVGLVTYYLVSGQFGRGAEMALRNLGVAEAADDDELRLEALLDYGNALFYLGRTGDSVAQLERCLALYVPERHHRHVLFYGKDPGAVAMVHLALCHATEGRAGRARELADAAVANTEQWPHPFSSLWALCCRAAVSEITGDFEGALATGRVVVEKAQREGFPNWLAQGLCYMGHGNARAGNTAEGIAQLRQGLAIWEATGSALLQPFLRYLLADALRIAGDLAASRAEVEAAIAIAERTGEKWFFAGIARLRDELARPLA